MTEFDHHVRNFEQVLDVRFKDGRLLQRALTHRSFVNEYEGVQRDNERLEFLGDAVLDLIVAEMLFRRFPDVSEGELTQLRAALVRTDSLAMLAQDLRLGEYLLMGKGEENSGGRERVNNLCRGFEAVIGALYLDRGVEAVRRFVVPRLTRLLDYILANALHKDARSILQERAQADLRFTPIYRLQDTVGPDHEREFVIDVYIGDVLLAYGSGTSKRAAAQSAARAALTIVEETGWSDEMIDAAERYNEILRQRDLADGQTDDILDDASAAVSESQMEEDNVSS